MAGTARPLDSGRKDALGRTVKLAAGAVESRASAPAPAGFDPALLDDLYERLSGAFDRRKPQRNQRRGYGGFVRAAWDDSAVYDEYLTVVPREVAESEAARLLGEYEQTLAEYEASRLEAVEPQVELSGRLASVAPRLALAEWAVMAHDRDRIVAEFDQALAEAIEADRALTGAVGGKDVDAVLTAANRLATAMGSLVRADRDAQFVIGGAEWSGSLTADERWRAAGGVTVEAEYLIGWAKLAGDPRFRSRCRDATRRLMGGVRVRSAGLPCPQCGRPTRDLRVHGTPCATCKVGGGLYRLEGDLR